MKKVFTERELINAILDAGYNTDALLDRFIFKVKDANYQRIHRSNEQLRADLNLPEGQKYSSIDFEINGIADVQTSLGSMYELLNTGQGSLLTVEILQAAGLDHLEAGTVVDVVKANSSTPIGFL